MVTEIMQASVYVVFHLVLGYGWFSFWQGRGKSAVDSVLASLLTVLAQTIAGVFLLGLLGLFSTLTIWLWQILIIVVVYWLSRRQLSLSWRLILRRSWYDYLFLVLLTTLSLSTLILSFRSSDVSFDSLNYHLPWAAYLLQEGRLDYFQTLIPWINVYPKAIEAWQAWHLALWHNQSLLQVTNLIFWLLGFGAVYALAREFSISRFISLLAALTYAVTPLNILQLRTNYIDLALSSLVLLLLYWSVKKFDESWWLWSITAGILIGAKATMVIMVMLALVVKVISGWTRPYKWPWYVLTIAGFGSYFYARNWWASGTPIYPIGPKLISLDQLLSGSQAAILKGKPMWEQLWLNFTTVHGQYSYQMNPGGFGWLWLLILWPALMIFLFWGWKQRQFRLMTVVLVLVIGFLLMPANWWLRYGLFIVAAGSLSLAYILACLPCHWRGVGCGIVVLFIIHSCLITGFSWQRTQLTDYYPEFRSLASIQQSGSVIAYDSRLQLPFVLWNQDLSNRVVFVSSADKSYDQWMTGLRAAKVQYIVTKYPSLELQQIDSHKASFELLASQGDVKVWRVR